MINIRRDVQWARTLNTQLGLMHEGARYQQLLDNNLQAPGKRACNYAGRPLGNLDRNLSFSLTTVPAVHQPKHIDRPRWYPDPSLQWWNPWIRLQAREGGVASPRKQAFCRVQLKRLGYLNSCAYPSSWV